MGSEMCIRDRCIAGDCVWTCDSGWESCDGDASTGCETNLLDDPCLLYTSDAADDLLCVDLGGRRIIKKKSTGNPHIATQRHILF